MSKTIIVTGAASAYGRAIVQTLAQEGHGVVAIMEPADDTNQATANELRQTDNVELVEIEGKNDESVRSGLAFILRRYGHVDVLITNECPVKLGLAETTSLDYYQEVFNSNVWGALRAFKVVLPTMRKNKSGLLINVSSGINYFALPFIAALTMARAGLEILTDGIIREVKMFGIESVNLWTGFYPVELLDDNSGIPNTYGKVNAWSVAALILEIINMQAGTRPPRFCLNPHFDQAEIQFIKTKVLNYIVYVFRNI